MHNLLNSTLNIVKDHQNLPFSLYSSIKEQKLLNVPIPKPLLIVVLQGEKTLGKHHEVICRESDFIFLPSSPAINIRNIPKLKEYHALLIEFDVEDFAELPIKQTKTQKYCVGKTTSALNQCLQQYVESTLWAPKSVLLSRKKEILSLINHMGYEDVLSLAAQPSLAQRIHDMFCAQNLKQLSIENICHHLAMSESTLRRKLKLEGNNIQEIKDQARLGQALHLLQTTLHSIGSISEQCGYQSQSRFTERFKIQFGLTPTELRKTKVAG